MIIVVIMPIIEEQPLYTNSPRTVILGMLFVGLVFGNVMIDEKIKIYFDKFYVAYILAIFSVSVYVIVFKGERYLNVYNIIVSFVNTLISYLFIVIFSSNAEKDYFFKIYKIACVIVAMGVFLQAVSFFLLRIHLGEVKVGGIVILVDHAFTSIYRPSFSFSEPSHVAQYLLPIIFYELHFRRKIFWAVVFTAAIAATTSGIGVLLGGAVWIIYFLKLMTTTGHVKQKALLIMAVAIMGYFLINGQSNSGTVDRIAEGGTVGPRFYRGFMIYSMLPNDKKFMGLGLQNVAIYAELYDVRTIYDEYAFQEYMNTFAYLLCSTGIISLAFFIILMIRLLRISEYEGKVVTILFICLCLVGNQFTRLILVFYLVIVYMLCDKKKLSRIN